MLPSEEVETFDLRTEDGAKGLLRATVLTVEDVVGEDDKPLPYTPELLEQLLSNYAARMAMVNTYFAAVTKARLGN
jgi:hypothetical protein